MDTEAIYSAVCAYGAAKCGGYILDAHDHIESVKRLLNEAEEEHKSLLDTNEKLVDEVCGLEAARIAYASEFPPSDDSGLPEVDRIHENIRRLKAENAELKQRVAGLEANEKVLLAQVQGHTQWREKIIDASVSAYGESAIRYKFSLTKSGKCMNTFPREIDGRWFALTPAEDDGHIGHIARIQALTGENAELKAELERIKALEPVAWLTRNDEGDPQMLFFDPAEARTYCDDDEEPEPLYLHPAPPGANENSMIDLTTSSWRILR
jgi:hypothetical protein